MTAGAGRPIGASGARPATVTAALGLALAARQRMPEPVVLVDDGGWCWFEDESSVVDGRFVIFGSIASGRRDPALPHGSPGPTPADSARPV